jgi:hypothetical protein
MDERDYGGRLTVKRLGGTLVILGLLVTLPAPVWLSLMNVAPSSRWWELRFVLMGIGFGIVALGVLLSRLAHSSLSNNVVIRVLTLGQRFYAEQPASFYALMAD